MHVVDAVESVVNNGTVDIEENVSDDDVGNYDNLDESLYDN